MERSAPAICSTLWTTRVVCVWLSVRMMNWNTIAHTKPDLFGLGVEGDDVSCVLCLRAHVCGTEWVFFELLTVTSIHSQQFEHQGSGKTDAGPACLADLLAAFDTRQCPCSGIKSSEPTCVVYGCASRQPVCAASSTSPSSTADDDGIRHQETDLHPRLQWRHWDRVQ